MHGASEILPSCSEMDGIAYECSRIGGRKSTMRWGVLPSQRGRRWIFSADQIELEWIPYKIGGGARSKASNMSPMQVWLSTWGLRHR